VAVVGVGALGGPIALELARAGVGFLHLVDGDRHDAATSARQLPGIVDAGDAKALAVAKRIFEFNPHTRISAGLRHLGADEGLELPRLLGSDLVVDASANPSASRYLAAHLRLSSTPLLVASATAGGWGGTLTTLPADGGGC
jgi:molybdopterin/thiamine biosynthesis adenylyltransferase